MRQLTITLIILTSIVSCDIRDDLDSFLLVDTEKYNKRIEEWRTNGKSWTEDPILISRELFRTDERKTTIEFENKTIDRATVTLTQEGLSDDSVDGEKRIINFERVNGSWTITQIRLGFKCWEHRGGHTNYSGELCS